MLESKGKPTTTTIATRAHALILKTHMALTNYWIAAITGAQESEIEETLEMARKHEFNAEFRTPSRLPFFEDSNCRVTFRRPTPTEVIISPYASTCTTEC